MRGQVFEVEGPRTRGFFLMHPGQPLPMDGAGLGQVSAVGRLLYLAQAQPAQEGTYTCECSNVAGNSSQDQQLEVLGESGWDDLNQAEGARWGPKGGQPGALAGQTSPQNPSKDKTGLMRALSCYPLALWPFNCPLPPASFLQLLTSA